MSEERTHLAPVVGGGTGGRLDRCGDLFEDFCTVTASVQHGIPVHVSLKAAENKNVA
jgi:hypothetical protein